VAEFTLHLDDALLDRFRTLAEQRGCSLEALIAQSLQEQLPAEARAPDPKDAAATPWSQEESAFLHEIARAIDEVPASTPLAADDPEATEWDKPGS
jgi:predicted transcriptional regulator